MNPGSEHHHPEQIPTEYTEEQTLRAVRRQSQISGGKRKEKTINDFPKAAEAAGQIFFKDLDFPADKQTIVTFVDKLNTPESREREILPVIEKLNVRNGTKVFQKLQMLQDLSSDIEQGMDLNDAHASLRKLGGIFIIIHNNLKLSDDPTE